MNLDAITLLNFCGNKFISVLDNNFYFEWNVSFYFRKELSCGLSTFKFNRVLINSMEKILRNLFS